jgi:hypothetical protein
MNLNKSDFPSQHQIVPNSGQNESMAPLKPIASEKPTQASAQVDQQKLVCSPSVGH